MRRTRSAALALLLLGTFAFQACTESPTAPGSAPAANSLLGGLLGNPVDVVHRTVPLAQDEVATATIGYAGGTLYLPQAGLTVVVPTGALSTATTIKITAPAGDLMGYYFEPHGLVFKKPLHAVQSLDGAELGLLQKLLAQPVAAYFTGTLQPQVNALQLLPLDVWGLLNRATFDIPHFSGYVIATD
jgi:hypothetical protein